MRMPEEKTVRILVDHMQIIAKEGDNLLQACLANQIYIPHLCHVKGRKNTPASCRLCFVEVDGSETPITACTVRVKDGMSVQTDTEPVRGLQRSALRLLLSAHHTECSSCPANKKCELQRIARFLKVGLKPKHLDPCLKKEDMETGQPFLNYHPNRCVLCGLCTFVCEQTQGRLFLTFAKRGLDTAITFYGEKEASKLPCGSCLACVEICPVCAITPKEPPQP